MEKMRKYKKKEINTFKIVKIKKSNKILIKSIKI